MGSNEFRQGKIIYVREIEGDLWVVSPEDLLDALGDGWSVVVANELDWLYAEK